MKQRDENKFSMYQATNEHLSNTSDIWGSNMALSNSHNELNKELKELGKLAKQQKQTITGYAKDKEECENSLIVSATQVGGALYALSYIKGDNSLAEKASVTKSELKVMNDNDVFLKCNNIYDVALDYAGLLADYGITQTMLDDFANNLKNFHAIISTPRDMIDDRASATDIIKVKFAKIDGLLKNVIDNLVKIYEFSHPQFYAKYKHARIIVNLGIRHENQVEDNQN